MTMTDGFWVSPDGKISEVERSHIRTVLNHPEQFGRDKEALIAIYDKYKEPIGFEGHAREEIMLGIMAEGWIRVRYLARKGWTLEYVVGVVSRRQLRDTMDRLVSAGKANTDDDMFLNGYVFDKDGTPRLAQDEDYYFDKDSGEGGVLTFLDSSAALFLVEAYDSASKHHKALVHQSAVPSRRYIDQILTSSVQGIGLVFKTKTNDGLALTMLTRSRILSFIDLGDKGKLRLLYSKAATGPLAQAFADKDIAWAECLLNSSAS